MTRMDSVFIMLTAVVAVGAGSPAGSQSPSSTTAPSVVFGKLLDCRGVQDAVQRLACFDREATVLNQAQASGDLVAMDRLQVRKARRSLFGLALPDLGIFGDAGSNDGSSQLETTIRTARQDPSGKWVFDLVEGGRWAQLDSREFVIDPAPGQAVRIRRAAMGSYLANVNKQNAIRVRRLN